MDLLAGREGFAPDLPHSYEASESFSALKREKI